MDEMNTSLSKAMEGMENLSGSSWLNSALLTQRDFVAVTPIDQGFDGVLQSNDRKPGLLGRFADAAPT